MVPAPYQREALYFCIGLFLTCYFLTLKNRSDSLWYVLGEGNLVYGAIARRDLKVILLSSSVGAYAVTAVELIDENQLGYKYLFLQIFRYFKKIYEKMC